MLHRAASWVSGAMLAHCNPPNAALLETCGLCNFAFSQDSCQAIIDALIYAR